MSNASIQAPGVYYQEEDLSQYIRRLSDTILALVITATRGPTDTPTLVTSYTDFVNKFGIPDEAHPGAIVAREFLSNGGNTVWVVRVAHNDATASATLTCIDGTSTITLTAIETGSFFNSLSFPVSYGSQLSVTKAVSETEVVAGSQTFNITVPKVPLTPGTVVVSLAGTQAGKDDGNGNLVFTSSFSTYSGTVNYKTGAVAITVTGVVSGSTKVYSITSNYYSTFTVQTLLTLTDGNGNVVTKKVLAASQGLTLANMQATLATNPYLAAIEVTPTAFPNANVFAMTGGDDGISTITDANFIGNTIGGVATGMQCFAGADVIDINEIMCPGQTSAGIRQALIQLCTNRQDCMCPLDPPSNTNVQTVVDWANATGSYSSYGVIDSNYSSIYFPWYTSTNPDTGAVEVTPPTAAIAQTLARIDWWQAPAGPVNGLLMNCLDTSIHLNGGDRQYLGANRVNSIGNLAGLGIQVLGQYTGTLTASSLDRVAARRALLRIEKSVTTAMYPLLFQPNIQSTWDQATALVQPYLDQLAASGRIYNGKFYCDKSVNSDDAINNNQMNGVVVLQLLKFAEKILISFVLTAEGVQITENLVPSSLPNV